MAKSAAARNEQGDSHAKKNSSQTSAADTDKVIHERKRLAIISSLAVNESLTFTELKSTLKLSDGNLSVHAQKLETAGYIMCTKGFDGRTPRTQYAITHSGRDALERYLNHMEQLIAMVRNRG